MFYLLRAVGFSFSFPWRKKLIVETETPYEAVFALLGLTIVTAASFAVAINAIPNSEVPASILYLITSAFVILLASTLASSRDETGDYEYQNDRATMWCCFLVNVATVVFTIVFITIARNGWFPGQQPVRHDYTAPDVKCADPILVSKKTEDANVLGMFGSAEADDAADFKNFISWFTDFFTFDSKKKQILLIDQYPGFDQDYNTFSGVMTFNSDVIFKNALIFIRRKHMLGSGSMIYRILAPTKDATDTDLEQLRIARSQSEVYPVITVPHPDNGDQLIIFVQVEAESGKDLPQTAGDFKFKLRRVQR